jgi:hypothetical protein
MLGLVIALVAIVISLAGVTIQLLVIRKSIDNIAVALGHKLEAE